VQICGDGKKAEYRVNIRTSVSPSPAALRQVLGDNLRQLCRDIPSVSKLCTEIGVNRTQFNRYLSGEAFPRPDVLHRICSRFGVDANILLVPLQPRERDPMEIATDALYQDVMSLNRRPFDHYLLPDAMYRFWRMSFQRPGAVYSSLARISTRDGTKHWKATDVFAAPIRGGSPRFARTNQSKGVMFQHFDGVSLICATSIESTFNLTFFEYGLAGQTRYYTGLSFLTRRRTMDSNRLSVTVMERLPEEPALWRQVARASGLGDAADVPPEVLAALQRLPDRI
jgi:transcriptional regulator with XRE-family HTH domain